MIIVHITQAFGNFINLYLRIVQQFDRSIHLQIIHIFFRHHAGVFAEKRPQVIFADIAVFRHFRNGPPLAGVILDPLEQITDFMVGAGTAAGQPVRG